MAFRITKACTSCGACLSKCPTNSISVAPLQYVIDADTCDDHAACTIVCPVKAIEPLGSRIEILKAPKAESDKKGARSQAKSEVANPKEESSSALEAILTEYGFE